MTAPQAAAPPPSRRGAAIISFVAGVANVVLGAAQALILTPRFVQAMGKRLYGSWLSSGNVLGWIQSFDLGLPTILIQRIGAAHGRGDEEAIGRWLFSGLLSLAVVAAGVVAAAAVVAPRLPHLFDVPAAEAARFSLAFLLAAVATAGIILHYAVVGFARGTQRTAFMGTIMATSQPVGFVVTLVLLMRGLGVLSIAWGMVARTTWLVSGSALFTVRHLTPGIRRGFRFHREVMSDALRLMPFAALGGVSFAAMNQSELAILGYIIDPAVSASYFITRRLADVAMAVADTVSFASFGSFAHLVTSDQRSRALVVYSEILSLRTSLTFALVSAYVAMNPSFVGVWVSPKDYGGLTISLLVAAQALIAGGAWLVNYLYRATGAVAEGSIALAVEAVIRVALMVAGAHYFGVRGLILASIATASVFGWLAHRWTVGRLREFAEPDRRVSVPLWIARGALLGAAALTGSVVSRPSWAVAVALGAVFAGGGCVLLLGLDPRASVLKGMARDFARRVPALKGV